MGRIQLLRNMQKLAQKESHNYHELSTSKYIYRLNI